MVNPNPNSRLILDSSHTWFIDAVKQRYRHGSRSDSIAYLVESLITEDWDELKRIVSRAKTLVNPVVTTSVETVATKAVEPINTNDDDSELTLDKFRALLPVEF